MASKSICYVLSIKVSSLQEGGNCNYYPYFTRFGEVKKLAQSCN